jgi:hypothetical protein
MGIIVLRRSTGLEAWRMGDGDSARSVCRGGKLGAQPAFRPSVLRRKRGFDEMKNTDNEMDCHCRVDSNERRRWFKTSDLFDVDDVQPIIEPVSEFIASRRLDDDKEEEKGDDDQPLFGR